MVSPRYHPKVGGIETHMTEISLTAIDRGWDVTVHCTRHDPDLDREDEHRGIGIRRYDPRVEIGYYTTLFEPDLPDDAIVHLHAFGHWTNRWVLNNHPRERTLLTTHHGIDFPTIPVVGTLYYALYRRLAIPSLAELHRVVTMNTTDRDRLVDRGVPPERLEVIPSGIHEEAFEEPETSPGPERFVLYVGRVHREKGLAHLVRAARDLDADVLVAGPDDGDRERLEALAEDLGVEGKVEFLGMVPEDTKRGLLREADAFALPSRHEGLGLVLLEAWAQGTPVVATDTDGARDLVEDGEDGRLVPVDDRDALVDALQRLLEDPDHAAEMGERGREKTWEQYRWPVLADATVDLYDAVDGPPG